MHVISWRQIIGESSKNTIRDPGLNIRSQMHPLDSCPTIPYALERRPPSTLSLPNFYVHGKNPAFDRQHWFGTNARFGLGPHGSDSSRTSVTNVDHVALHEDIIGIGDWDVSGSLKSGSWQAFSLDFGWPGYGPL